MIDTLTENFRLWKIGRRKGWASQVNENFERLGKLFVIDNAGNTCFVNNARYNSGTNTWSQPDTTKASTVLALAASGNIGLYKCAAGSSTIAWDNARYQYQNPLEVLTVGEDSVYYGTTNTIYPSKHLVGSTGSPTTETVTISQDMLPNSVFYKKAIARVTIATAADSWYGYANISVTNAITGTNTTIVSCTNTNNYTREFLVGVGDVIKFYVTGTNYSGGTPNSYGATFSASIVGKRISPSANLSPVVIPLSSFSEIVDTSKWIPIEIRDAQSLYSMTTTIDRFTYTEKEMLMLYPIHGTAFTLTPNPAATAPNLVNSNPIIYFRRRI